MWIDLLEDNRAIKAVFQEMPSLRQVLIHEVMIKQYDNSLILRLDLSDYPAKPPEKWQINKYNTVQIELELWGISSLEISGYCIERKVDIHVEKFVEGIALKINGQFNLSCHGEMLSVFRMSAYQDGQ
jgi:hypothetical protein